MDIRSIRQILDAAGIDGSKVILAEFERYEINEDQKEIEDIKNSANELMSRSPDCPTLIKRANKNQEKLSMFYAGKKRRKGGRYA